MSEEVFSVLSRKWVATLWLHQAHSCLEQTMRDLTDTGRIRFIAYGEEVCPETGTLHYQAYMVCYKPVRLSQMIRYFGEGHSINPMRGSLLSNEEYCSKEGAFHKLGDEPKQGERHDLIGFKRKLEEGLAPLEIAEEEGHFGTFVKYHGGMEKYHQHLINKKIKYNYRPPTIYVRIGEPGSGKTRWAYEFDRDLGKVSWTGASGFLLNYHNQPTVLFDDVEAGEIPPLAIFKKLTDRTPYVVNVKGSEKVWKPRTIIITSNYDICDWWKGMKPMDLAALERRIFRITRVYKHQPEQVVYQNPDPEYGLQEEA